MFGRMNKKISIDKLYLARIGIVKHEKYDLYEVNPNLIPRNLVIVEINHHYFDSYKYGTSPINGVEYDYFYDAHQPLSNYVGQVMIYGDIPLVNVVSQEKLKLSIKEIKKIEDEINKKIDSMEPEIEEPVLKEIKKLADKVKLIINEEQKRTFLEKINGLASYYVEELIKIKSSNVSSLCLTNPESALVMECLSQLCDLENLINIELKNSGILKDLMLLKRSLGSELNDRK
jgi:hypothetical protein